MPAANARLMGLDDQGSPLVVKIDQVLAYRDRIHHARCRVAANQTLDALKDLGVSARVFGKLTQPGKKLPYPSPIELCIVEPAAADGDLASTVGQTIREVAGPLGVRILWLEQLTPKMRLHILEHGRSSLGAGNDSPCNSP